MRERRKRARKSYAGSLLVAHPSLRDPNFRHAVILLSAHNEEGAMGIVMNRPLGKSLAAIQGDFVCSPLAQVPVYVGGPVEDQQLTLAAWKAETDGFRLQFGLAPDKAVEMLLADEELRLRGFLGYSGWSGGQLEDEMKHHTWLVANVPEDLLEREADDSLWRSILREIGEDWKLLADEPDDTSRN